MNMLKEKNKVNEVLEKKYDSVELKESTDEQKVQEEPQHIFSDELKSEEVEALPVDGEKEQVREIDNVIKLNFSASEMEAFKADWKEECMKNMPLRISTVEELPMAKQLENEINAAVESKDQNILNELNSLMVILGKIKLALNQSEVNYSQFTPIVKRLKFELFGITH